MIIDWIVPCRYVEVHDNLGTMVGAGIDRFGVPAFPAPLQVVMAVRLAGLPDDIVGKHTTRNIIKAPDGSVLSDLSGDFDVNAGGEIDTDSQWLQGLMFPLAIAFQADAPGTYTFEMTVDGSTAAVPLHVSQGPVPGMPPA